MGDGHVDLWTIALDAAPASGLDEEILSSAELARAARLRAGRARDDFVTTRAALRRILAGYLGLPPASVPLALREGGKPVLAPHVRDLRFSVSHTRGLALCAVALGQEVGVDVEWRDPATPWQAIAAAHFSAHELAGLMALVQPDQRPAFFAAWTRKEAQLKGLGTGFGRPAPEMEIPSGPWAVADVDVGSDYAAALAVQGEAARFRLSAWPMPKQSAA